jgi:hypothetical protein
MVPSEPTVQNVQNGQIFFTKKKFMKKGGWWFFFWKKPRGGAGGTSGQKNLSVLYVLYVSHFIHRTPPCAHTKTMYGQKVPSGFVRFCQPRPRLRRPPIHDHTDETRERARARLVVWLEVQQDHGGPRAEGLPVHPRPHKEARGVGAIFTCFSCFSCSSGYGCSSTAPGDEHTAGSYANRAVALQTPEEKLREWVEERYTHVP